MGCGDEQGVFMHVVWWGGGVGGGIVIGCAVWRREIIHRDSVSYNISFNPILHTWFREILFLLDLSFSEFTAFRIGKYGSSQKLLLTILPTGEEIAPLDIRLC
jgi:hypothetical protein